jgi:hypothetical protein
MGDLLNRAGEMALLAIAAPFMVADAVRDVRRSGEDVDAARAEALRMEGERDEARRLMADMDRRRVENAVGAAELARRLAEVTDERRILAKEVDRLAHVVHMANMTQSATERERNDARGALRVTERAAASATAAKDHAEEQANALRVDLAAAELRALDLQRELDAMTAERDTQRQAIADHRAHLDAKQAEAASMLCAWCMKRADPDCTVTFTDVAYPLCHGHWEDSAPTMADIVGRAAARLASCPTRRTSPDPHAVPCTTCGAFAWHGCGGGPETRNDVAP